jgi:hypothetical protein
LEHEAQRQQAECSDPAQEPNDGGATETGEHDRVDAVTGANGGEAVPGPEGDSVHPRGVGRRTPNPQEERLGFLGRQTVRSEAARCEPERKPAVVAADVGDPAPRRDGLGERRETWGEGPNAPVHR